MLAATPFAHQVNIRLQQCCVVLVGVYLATPVVCWRFWCFLLGSWLWITGRHGTVAPWAGGGCAVTPQEKRLVGGLLRVPISGALPISKGFDSMHASTNISRHTVIRFREEWSRSTLSRF